MHSSQIMEYYDQGREQNRLTVGSGQLELIRSQEIVLRYLPKPPAVVMDIGGGAGIYAFWLAELGYTVHLIDLTPLHIEQAKAQATTHPLASAAVGDARHVNFPDASADAVLLFGPLYHLTERADRIQTLREAYRLLKPSGLLFAATISRFASLMDGLKHGFIADDHFAELAAQDLVDGQHRNPTGQRGYFTTAFFHHPDEIQNEVTEAGFTLQGAIAVESVGSFINNFDTLWENPVLRERLLQFIRTVESEPAVLGATGHMITVGRKPV